MTCSKCQAKFVISFEKSILHLVWIELKKENPQICNNLRKELITLLPEALRRIDVQQIGVFIMNDLEITEEKREEYIKCYDLTGGLKQLQNAGKLQAYFVSQLCTIHSEIKPDTSNLKNIASDFITYHGLMKDDNIDKNTYTVTLF